MQIISFSTSSAFAY